MLGVAGRRAAGCMAGCIKTVWFLRKCEYRENKKWKHVEALRINTQSSRFWPNSYRCSNKMPVHLFIRLVNGVWGFN